MKSFHSTFLRYYGKAQIGLASLVMVAVLYQILFGHRYPVPSTQINTLHKIIFLGGELFLLTFLLAAYSKDKWKGAGKPTFVLIFLFVNCFFVLPFLRSYQDDGWSVVLIIRLIQPYLIPGYVVLLVATGLCALLARRDVKRFRAWLVGIIDRQKQQDEQTESLRGTRFVAEHPQIAKIPVLGCLILAIYSEGWGYVLSLGALIVTGLLLRLWNLDGLPPYIDEYHHLIAAKNLLSGVPLDQIDYRRSLYIVTLPVFISFKVLGQSLWAARFAGVLVNGLAVIPLYLLCKRVNKHIALLAVGLFMFNPWIIAVSRLVREYAYYAMYFYWIAWSMVKLYEALPSNLVLLRDYRKLLTAKILVYVGVLILVVYYIYRIDTYTFKVVLVLYPVFGAIVMRKLDWRDISNIGLIIGALVLLGLGVGVLLVSGSQEYVTINESLNSYYLYLFYEQPLQQWYYNRPLISFLVLLIALLVTSFFDNKKLVLAFTFLIYLFSHISFALFRLHGYNKPRYASSIEFWHVIIMAVGLFAIYFVLRQLTGDRYKMWVGIGLLLAFWNVPHSFVPSLHTDSGIFAIPYEYHADLAPGYQYLQTQSSEGDVLVVSKYFGQYLLWQGGLTGRPVIRYVYKQPNAEKVIYAAIEDFPQGWIIMDYQQGFLWSQPVPLEDFSYADKQVTFLGWHGDQYILRWDETFTSP